MVSQSISRGQVRLRSRNLAEDAVQEALLRFWRVLPRLKDPERAERYFLRVVANEARRIRSRSKAEREAAYTEGTASGVTDAAGEGAELAEALVNAVAGLPERLRAAVEIRYYGGFTEAETAELLGISLASAKMRLSRARKKLRELLERDGFDVTGG